MKTNKKVSLWRTWARALGEKVGEDSKRADRVAIIRTCIVLYAITVDTFILLNILKGWIEK